MTEEGAFENSLSAFGSLLSDGIAAARDVLVAKEDRKIRETEAVLRAKLGIPPPAQSQSYSATTAPLPASPFGSNTIVLGLIGLLAAVLLIKG